MKKADKQKFFQKVLEGLKLTASANRMSFFLEWADHEGGDASFNPINTTWGLSKDTGMTMYNSHKVRNYSTFDFGVEATVKTLKQGYYKALMEALTKDLDTRGIMQYKGAPEALKTWGTANWVNAWLKKLGEKVEEVGKKGVATAKKNPITSTVIVIALIAAVALVLWYLNSKEGANGGV